MQDFQFAILFGGGFATLFQQIADVSMTDHRDANLLPLLYQLEDHVRAGIRLARARRPMWPSSYIRNNKGQLETSHHRDLISMLVVQLDARKTRRPLEAQSPSDDSPGLQLHQLGLDISLQVLVLAHLADPPRTHRES